MKRSLTFIASTLVAGLFACGAGFAADYPARPFEFIAPAGAGGGWDTTIRMVGKVLTEEKLITQGMPVVNKPGGGGAVALAYMQKKKGNPYTVTVFSPPLLLINLSGQTPLGYKNLTPLAMLINDFGAYAVPKDSRFKTIGEVMDALKKDPKSVKVGGTSSAGSMDHIQFLQAAKAAGVKDLKSIPYISLQEGSMAALMGSHVDLLSTGMAETVGALESGDIKVLAISSPERIKNGPLSKVPTLKEGGIDTVFINWRGLFGTPDMPAAEKAVFEEALKKMAATANWESVCVKNGWDSVFMGSADFTAFLEKTNGEYKALLSEIGFLKQ